MKYTAASDGPQAIKSRHSPSLLERSKPNNKRCCACICEEPSAPSKATHEAGRRGGVSIARWGGGAALGFNQAKPWPWSPIQRGKPWPWGAVIELGAGADAGANQGQAQALGAGAQSGKALAVIWPALGAGTGVHPARPWQWWPVIELVQAQHWALTRQSPSPGCWCSTRASPGRGGR